MSLLWSTTAAAIGLEEIVTAPRVIAVIAAVCVKPTRSAPRLVSGRSTRQRLAPTRAVTIDLFFALLARSRCRLRRAHLGPHRLAPFGRVSRDRAGFARGVLVHLRVEPGGGLF